MSPATPQKIDKRERLTQAQRREESSQRLLDTAFRLIAKAGVRSLSLSAIAEAAGCSRELPRYLFGSKDAFIEALLDDCQGVFGEHLQRPQISGRVGLEAVLGLFESVDEFFGETSVITRGRLLLMFELASSDNEALRKKINEVQAYTRRQFVRFIEDGVAAGQLAKISNPEAFAALLHGAYRGVSFQWLTDPDSIDIAAVLQQLRELFLRGMMPPKRNSRRSTE